MEWMNLLIRRRKAKLMLILGMLPPNLSCLEIYRRLLTLQQNNYIKLLEHAKMLGGMLMRNGTLGVITNSTRRMREKFGLSALSFNNKEICKIGAATKLRDRALYKGNASE